jgi:hypothetical protein
MASRIYLDMAAKAVTFFFTILASVSVLLFKGRPLCIANCSGWSKTVMYALMALALMAFLGAMHLATKRDTYLPFLGEAAFPRAVLAKDDVQAIEAAGDRTMRVMAPIGGSVRDGSLVVYWAAKADKDDKVISTPREAYADSSNAGVAEVRGGKAALMLACPSRYTVRGKTLNRHVHYRVQQSDGLFGPVMTLKIQC